MSWKNKIQESFQKSSETVFSQLRLGEEASLSLDAEESDFVRFNKGKVRQTTAVEQAQAQLTFQTQTKLTRLAFPLTGDLAEDRRRSLFFLGKARQEIESLPNNPYPLRMAETGSSQVDEKAQTPSADFIVSQVQESLEPSDDFVGFMASGPLMKAIANSKGTFHWHSSDLFFMDYSLYSGKAGAAKAVTANIAGQEWDQDNWNQSVQQSRTFLHQLQKPTKILDRGDYRVYLAPGAMHEVRGLLSWGAFSQSAFQQGQCGLRLLAQGERKLSSKVSIRENFRLGLHPRFNSTGELAEFEVPLIEKGELRGLLTSSKTAAEFGIPSTGADLAEAPVSLEFAGGHLKRQDIFKALGTGLYLSNLHYMNWSDQASARVTGMTRFACFWVENGEIVSPIQDMRFDVSLYDILGEGLVDITDFQETLVNNLTYGSRAFGGSLLPGLLIKDFKLTL
jgi:predicted Zn-dependent protease